MGGELNETNITSVQQESTYKPPRQPYQKTSDAVSFKIEGLLSLLWFYYSMVVPVWQDGNTPKILVPLCFPLCKLHTGTAFYPML